MLRCTSIPIGEIAERCGFNSSSYFIQTFKKKEGITPLAYRKYFLQIDAT
jgi:AraC family transcriptional regulator, melibiose operon regulatory protein